jgi:fructose-1,6-bisphosphatase-3
MYYLWCGKKSPLFGKDRMTTFERYFVADEACWKEKRDPYYGFVDDFEAVCRILEEFGLDRNASHVINGHVPVVSGENPIKAGGRYILIDGGFCKAYHKKTGIAGYTLIYSSRGLRLVAHGQFDGKVAALKENKDIIATRNVVFEMMTRRKTVIDTDEGREIIGHMDDLKMLLGAYLEGTLKQAGE